MVSVGAMPLGYSIVGYIVEIVFVVVERCSCFPPSECVGCYARQVGRQAYVSLCVSCSCTAMGRQAHLLMARSCVGNTIARRFGTFGRGTFGLGSAAPSSFPSEQICTHRSPVMCVAGPLLLSSPLTRAVGIPWILLGMFVSCELPQCSYPSVQ